MDLLSKITPYHKSGNVVQSCDSFITDSLTGILKNDYDDKSDSFISEKTDYLDKEFIMDKIPDTVEHKLVDVDE